MKRNPFINDNNKADGTLPEKLHLRHALFAKEGKFPDVDEEWAKFQKRIAETEKPEVIPDSKILRRPIFSRWMAAAVVAVILGAVGMVMYFTAGADNIQSREIFVAQIPSVDRITVTSNSTGESRRITSSTFTARPSGERVAVTDIIDTLTVEVPVGQEVQVVLPDSTKVWLWANSKLKYPEKFTSSTRTVQLTGEAFFDVATDSLCPFVVQTPYFTTRVFGTEFVVSAFNQASSFVVLVNGSVAVDIPADDTLVRLSPGQEATISDNESIMLQEVDTYPWEQRRDGFFYFDEESLFKILLEVGRWYNVTVISQNEDALNRQIHFVADRTENPDEVVNALNRLIDDAEITMDDGQIIIR